MRNLLIFFIRFHAFFLFLLLTAICLFLIYREKGYQRAAMVNSANAVVGTVQKTRNNISDYFRLRRINDNLLAENARLREELANAWYSDTSRFVIVNDSVMDTVTRDRTQLYRYLPAKVINNSVHRFDNYLTLLAGSRHGVTQGMGVIGPNGVVGIVRDVAANTSRAFSLLHHQVNIPAKLKRSADQGRVKWQDTDPDFAYLIDIGQHVKLQKGDTVTTSGFSVAFPPDVMIGVVESFSVNHGTGFLEIRIRLSTNFRRLEHVYIVENLLSKELLTIEHDRP